LGAAEESTDRDVEGCFCEQCSASCIRRGTIAHTSARTLSRNVAAGRSEEQAEEYRRVAAQLAAAGADVVVITSMGGHFCAKEFAARSPLPMIDGPQAVADSLEAEGIKRIGILGTRIVMETALYGALHALSVVTPTGAQRQQVNDDYVAMAIAGAATPDQRARLIGAGAELVREGGAEAILLGGTDLNLVYRDANPGFRVIDSAALHADAIVRTALPAP
jgi:aspartate racemase